MRVPQVIKPHPGQTGIAEDLVEPVEHVGRVHWGAPSRREDEILFFPRRAGEQAQHPLLLLVLAKRLNGDGRNLESPAAPCSLRVGKFKPADVSVLVATSSGPPQGPEYREGSVVKVQIRPLKTEHLALPHAGCNGKDIEGLVALTVDGSDKGAGFVRVQEPDLESSWT